MDLEKIDTVYAPDFENVRVDRKGNVVTLTKGMFMQRFREMAVQGEKQEPTDDVVFLTTSIYDNHGSVLMSRLEDDRSALYNFVWRMQDGTPTELVREFTMDEDISYLVQILQNMQK